MTTLRESAAARLPPRRTAEAGLELKMTRDPWTDRDPQPGDFDADLSAIDSRHVETYVGDPKVKLAIVLAEDGDAEERCRFER